MLWSLANFQVANHFDVPSSVIKIGTCLQIRWRQLVIVLIERVGHYLCIVWDNKFLTFSAVCALLILGHMTSPSRQGLLVTVHTFCKFRYNALRRKIQGISTLRVGERRGSVWGTNLKLSTGSCWVRVPVMVSNYFWYEIPCFLWDTKVDCRRHNSPPVVSKSSSSFADHSFTPCFRIHCTIFLPSTLSSF